MKELVFVGLGLNDEKGISLNGLEEARSADAIFMELYTSLLPDFSLKNLEKIVGIPSAEKSGKRYSPGQIMLRALFAGALVAGVILAARVVPPYWVGILATFPAVLLPTMIILTRNQNAAFARATGKILVLSSTNIVVFGVAVYYTFPVVGIVGGALISFLCSFCWVWLFMPIVRKFS
ncbi:MAG: hypothetical protein MUD09_07470 [Desulfobacterales bacterium]|nr:hypothetical protein [Desulfobacterales bacterium]